ncbi:MAG: hypothetical protein WD645_03990, partial [Dehalococcoidia bacterium]
ETALDVLLTTARRADLADGRMLRLIQTEDGYGLTIDAPSGWDRVIEHQGVSILAVPRELAQSLADATIEAKEDDGAFQLLVRRTATAEAAA